MADMQNTFIKFHAEIKMETEELREKRDIILNKIKTSLKDQGHPTPELVNQGSYIYGVGIKPIGEIEPDIDVGLAFDIKSDDYEAKTVRGWVYDAIKDHTDDVESRGPCIRVRYAAGYHVDLVCYAKHKDNDQVENFQLATKENKWKPADPKALKDYISKAREPFKDTKENSSADQLQRATRFLKRWNDFAIPRDSEDKPVGIALLLFAIEKMPSPVLNSNGKSDDLQALIQVARAAKSVFDRIVVKKPTPEYEDVFSKLSAEAMTAFKKRFSDLHDALLKAQREPDLEKACALLTPHFGDDFPTGLKKSEERDSANFGRPEELANDMRSAIPTFAAPARPWYSGDK